MSQKRHKPLSENRHHKLVSRKVTVRQTTRKSDLSSPLKSSVSNGSMLLFEVFRQQTVHLQQSFTSQLDRLTFHS